MKVAELAKQMFQNKEIRIFGTVDNPLFVAADIGNILGLVRISSSISKFEEYEKVSVFTYDVNGKQRELIALTEAGLYSLVFKSKKPIAKEFKRWVLTDVLPNIRKNGEFISSFAQSKPKNTVDGLRNEIDSSSRNEITKIINEQQDQKTKYYECDINEFTNNPCVYLFHLCSTDYKFGISGEIDVRKAEHNRNFKKYNIVPKQIKFWKCETMQIMRDTETKIKKLATQNNILVNKYDQKEIITTGDIDFIVKKIDKYVNDQNSRETKVMEIKLLELKNKEKELENENMRLNIELLKLRERCLQAETQNIKLVETNAV